MVLGVCPLDCVFQGRSERDGFRFSMCTQVRFCAQVVNSSCVRPLLLHSCIFLISSMISVHDMKLFPVSNTEFEELFGVYRNLR